jgi:methylated-DNA-[protein]-cysteine S-methyltransferase
MADQEGIETIVAEPLRLTLHWRDGKLVRVGLEGGAPQAPQTPDNELSALGRAVGEALARYVAGEPTVWPELPLAKEEVTPFAWLALMELAKTSPGQILTYGQLAARCGRPKAARAIGRVMASNPWPLLVPCHRVLGAGGRLTGYSASGGLGLKAYLLDIEGASFRREEGESGRVEASAGVS